MTLNAEDKAKAAFWIKRARSDPYKAAFWKLALRLGRLPTTRDKEYWTELPEWKRGVG